MTIDLEQDIRKRAAIVQAVRELQETHKVQVVFTRVENRTGTEQIYWYVRKSGETIPPDATRYCSVFFYGNEPTVNYYGEK